MRTKRIQHCKDLAKTLIKKLAPEDLQALVDLYYDDDGDLSITIQEIEKHLLESISKQSNRITSLQEFCEYIKQEYPFFWDKDGSTSLILWEEKICDGQKAFCLGMDYHDQDSSMIEGIEEHILTSRS